MSHFREYVFDKVKLIVGKELGRKRTHIYFASQHMTLAEAEAFQCRLVEAINKAREMQSDPI